MTARFKKLFRLLLPLLSRDIKERYAGSSMGIMWTIIQPLLNVALFWLVFSRILKVKIQSDTGEIPFIAFLLSGLLPWIAFQEGVTRGASSIVDKGFIIKKVLYPSEIFPITSAISSLVHNGIAFVIFLSVYFISKGGSDFLYLPFIIFVLALQIMLTIGLAFLLASLSVYIRDILQIVPLVFQGIFYLAPIIYPMQSVPRGIKAFVAANPLTALIESYHSLILYGRLPAVEGVLYLALMSTMVFAAGLYVFRKLKVGFTDVL